ncbi:MAG TPA: alpha/beta hydrolase [Chloroflexia bacterium]|nr:alpha/beta hydrolase [Chloroflexia bacterium]
MPEVIVNNLRLNYQEAGFGPQTLVCLHGISSNSRSWRCQLKGLAERYRVIAWDARGYGQSQDASAPFPMSAFAADLAGLLDHLGVSQAVIVGLSMGGVIAQEFYRHYPERVKALVLADTNTGGGARPEAERQVRLQARMKAIETLTPLEMARQRGPALLSPHASAALQQEVIEMISEIHPAGYRHAALALDAADTRAVLPVVQVSTLVMWGEEDTVTPRAEAEALYNLLPAHLRSFKTIPGAGHLSNLEQPRLFNQAILNFKF